MKHISLFLPFAALVVVGSSCCAINKPKEARAFKLMDQMQADLQATLKAAIKARGAAAAIDECHTISPAMEKTLSSEGISIRRISDKTRNPTHAPDDFEAKVLTQWKAEIAAGKKPAPISEATGQGFRAMKPIMIANETCLTCHGDPAKIPADVKARLKEKYPLDQATGYAMNDLRGAFSVTMK